MFYNQSILRFLWILISGFLFCIWLTLHTFHFNLFKINATFKWHVWYKKTCSKANEYKYLVVGSFGPLKGPKSLQKEVDYENFNILAWYVFDFLYLNFTGLHFWVTLFLILVFWFFLWLVVAIGLGNSSFLGAWVWMWMDWNFNYLDFGHSSFFFHYFFLLGASWAS